MSVYSGNLLGAWWSNPRQDVSRGKLWELDRCLQLPDDVGDDGRELVADGFGAIEPAGEPADIAAGQSVELVVKNASILGQDWTFVWPKFAEEQAAAAASKGRKR